MLDDFFICLFTLFINTRPPSVIMDVRWTLKECWMIFIFVYTFVYRMKRKIDVKERFTFELDNQVVI